MIKAVPVAQAIYAQEWAVNASLYEAQGLYTTLTNELLAAADIRRVLDVGCGLGHGLQALAQAITSPDRFIVGVDENPDCLARAAKLLALGTDSLDFSRIKLEKLLKNRIGAKPSTIPLNPEGPVALVQADLMVIDAAFEDWLARAEPFDAVTMWFSGVHKAGSMTKVAHDVGATSDADLREALEKRVLELASEHLRPGGALQIAQRGVGDAEMERSTWATAASEIAELHGMEVVSVTAFEYQDPEGSHGMTLSALHFDASGLQRFVLSTLLRLREG